MEPDRAVLQQTGGTESSEMARTRVGEHGGVADGGSRMRVSRASAGSWEVGGAWGS